MKRLYHKFMIKFYKISLLINSGFGKCINGFIRFLEKGQAFARWLQK